jgi:predicted acylesterase/phospholipase RssA
MKSLTVSVLFFIKAASANKCKGLVLSGGSDLAVWEAGVMWGLSHYGVPEDYYWDVISGISAGSINTSITSGWKPEEVLEMTEFMSETYYSLQESWLFERRPNFKDMNQAHAVLNDDPALAFLRGILAMKPDFGRMVSVGALEVQTGEFWEFNQINTKYEDFAQAGLSSGSIPFALQPQHLHGGVLVDGGTVWDVNVYSAISQCRAVTENDEDITIDIVTIHSNNPPHDQIGNSMHNWRTVKKDIHWFWRDGLNYKRQLEACPKCNYRWTFAGRGPNDCPKDLRGLDFNGQDTWCLQEMGRNDALRALENDHYPQVTDALWRWADSPDLIQAYPNFFDYAF